MRHHSNVKKLGRKRNLRNALIKGLAVSLIRDKKIETTLAKAKALRPFIEKLVTKAKIGTLDKRRLVISRLGSQDMTKELFSNIAPGFKTRIVGYTRIIKTGRRGHDAAPMAII